MSDKKLKRDLPKNQFFTRISAAATNFEGTNSTLTSSPKEEEIYVECKYHYLQKYNWINLLKQKFTKFNENFIPDQPFALIATDNYETYAVYASCVPSTSGMQRKNTPIWIPTLVRYGSIIGKIVSFNRTSVCLDCFRRWIVY